MSCLVKIRSAQDCRTVPLFPCINGDNGTVGAFGVENFAHHLHDVCIPGRCHLVPKYECVFCGCWADPYPHWDCSVDPPVYCGCFCDPCSAYPHYSCVCVGLCPAYDCTCRYIVGYTELQCVPNEFKRLGPKSRALVMSLYRAIIERFFIMRATGCDCERPTDNTCSFTFFGFDPLFLAGNNCTDKRDLAGENPRRAFGGTFRDAMRSLIRKYPETGETETRCGVHFFPITPYTQKSGQITTFMPCAREYANGEPISWWPVCSGDPWYMRILTDRCFEAGWVLDNSMQRDLHCVLERTGDLRPLLKAIAAEYRANMTAYDSICRYVDYNLCRQLPISELQSISDEGGSSPLAQICYIHDFQTAMSRFANTCGCMISPPRFWLPALALALRMLSTLNAQTVRRGSCVTIPHKRITANFTLPIGTSDGRFVIGPERSCFKICDVDLHCAVTCAHLIYSGGFASYRGFESYFNLEDREWPPEYCCRETLVPVYDCVCTGTCYGPPHPHYACVCTGTCYTPPYPHYKCVCGCSCFYCGCYCDPFPHYECVNCGCWCDPFPHYECVCVGTCTVTCRTCNPNRDYVCATCILRWGVRTCATGYSSEHCASVTMRAIWPNLSGGGFQFGGAAYPARWAVRECDVAFGAVSAFVKGKCDKRAWVANKTDRPRHTLGECKDLMSVLGRGLIKAALQRAMCDQATCCLHGNTFDGTDFPTTANAAALEMVGENHAKNLEVIRCAAAGSGGGGGAVPYLSYHHLRVPSGAGRYTCIKAYWSADESTWDSISASPRWYDGLWLRLGSSGGGSIAFNYDRDYEKTGGCGGCGGCYYCDCCGCGGSGYTSTCVRHGWNLNRSSVQFGGFFGTFIFNNRSARQTS